MQAVQRKDCAPFWFHPIGGGIIPGIGHRKYTMAIGTDQQVKINGHCGGRHLTPHSDNAKFAVACPTLFAPMCILFYALVSPA
jgi:hypothetical protein